MVEDFPGGNCFEIRFYVPSIIQGGENVCYRGKNKLDDLALDKH